MTQPAKSSDGVHRLIDMVVEEVSLVDRAANKQRFLIVKRDDAMDEHTQNQDGPKTAASNGQDVAPAAASEASRAIAEGSPLAAALAALESLTAIVELLGSLGADASDVRLAALAQQLRITAEQILERTGFAPPSDAADAAPATEVQARAKGSKPPAAPGPLAADITKAQQALLRLGELVAKALPATSKPKEPPASNVSESLAKLAESFRALSETVKEQQQRLGRVEKQFGLPNSAAPGEHAPAARAEEVGWPIDLNQPKGREHVDKSVSFHDL